MIIESLINGILNVFKFLTSGIDIPSMPAEVSSYIDQALEYLTAGAGILANYCHLNYLIVLFGIVIAVEAGILIYKLVIWVLKKIPMLGIE